MKFRSDRSSRYAFAVGATAASELGALGIFSSSRAEVVTGVIVGRAGWEHVPDSVHS